MVELRVSSVASTPPSITLASFEANDHVSVIVCGSVGSHLVAPSSVMAVKLALNVSVLSLSQAS